MVVEQESSRRRLHPSFLFLCASMISPRLRGSGGHGGGDARGGGRKENTKEERRMKKYTRRSIAIIGALLAAFFMVAPSALSCPPVLQLWCDYDLTAGQDYDAGKVEIYYWAQGTNYWLEIKIISEDGWMISESQVHVDEGDDPIPATKKGNPKTGKFEYSTPATSTSTQHTYNIPLDAALDGCGVLEIAVHVVVYKGTGEDRQEETGWGGSEDFGGSNWALKLHFPCCKSPEFPEDVEIYMHFTTSGAGYWQITVMDDPNNPPSYDLDDYENIWAGSFEGWCVDKYHTMGQGNTWAELMEPTDWDPTIEWDKINWIVNHRDGYSDAEVQDAIWYFTDGIAVSGDAEDLRDDANTYGDGFHPSTGQWYAVVTDTDQKNIIILDP
jgi:hypothetical protein